MVERTNEDRQAAIDALYRVRAVESPPADSGVRTVWHRGRRGAELVSDLDAEGRVTRQELWLHDEVVVWVAGVFRTGTGPRPKDSPPEQSVTWDPAPAKERLERVAQALRTYRGTDRLIGHVRDVLGVSDSVPPPVERPTTETGAERRALEEARRREALREATRRRNLGTIGLVAGALVTLLGLLLLWRSL
ncbi:MAG: hypothetical protein MUC96_32955 [Myxococcaceae bacterium]|jgi:hypothetical protein|nr:hypothetical protein [Myxococcaceae bacterium]